MHWIWHNQNLINYTECCWVKIKFNLLDDDFVMINTSKKIPIYSSYKTFARGDDVDKMSKLNISLCKIGVLILGKIYKNFKI